MFRIARFRTVGFVLSVALSATVSRAEWKFNAVEIERELGVGYAVSLVDVNADGKLDIVVVDTERVLWYENPTWQRRVITEGTTVRDNVCLAPHDINGDGQVDFALGAGWKGLNTDAVGTIQWLTRGGTLVAHGRHNELMATQAGYRELVEAFETDRTGVRSPGMAAGIAQEVRS